MDLNIPSVTRRDMLEAEKVAGVPFGKLFITDDDGDQVATALGALAVQYVLEKRTGATEDDWDTWLDGDIDEFEVEETDPS